MWEAAPRDFGGRWCCWMGGKLKKKKCLINVDRSGFLCFPWLNKLLTPSALLSFFYFILFFLTPLLPIIAEHPFVLLPIVIRFALLILFFCLSRILSLSADAPSSFHLPFTKYHILSLTKTHIITYMHYENILTISCFTLTKLFSLLLLFIFLKKCIYFFFCLIIIKTL